MSLQQSTTLSSYVDKTQMGLDIEFGHDPASGAIFKHEGRKHDDLKQMLDSNKDSLKLEAMKRIISMVARGRDASDLFPAVVKNVVSKNIEVKKLVYVYLVRYAEEQQDLALLSISTFQRALKDPNQLIRASALRVLSSIRVSMIVPIVMLAIRDAAADLSPYVRKTAAHAIPKLYSLDAEQKNDLITVIEKLLSDRSTLVVGSAVMAFEEVCPERVDLVHKNYRKLCSLLVDVDEWGQIVIINMLTRYARTQFLDPNIDDHGAVADEEDKPKSQIIQSTSNNDEKIYNNNNESNSESSFSSESDLEEISQNNTEKKKKKSSQHASSSMVLSNFQIDSDHRLLLRQTKPLLQSRNASVVMAVAQLYHHIAPRQEVQIIAKALIRLLRSHKEIQSVVLTCIASMSSTRKTIFETYVKSFFVRTGDPTHIKLLKLEILTNLASNSCISLILREFQTYILFNDATFVAATIQAIGRCAASISEVTEICLSGLVHLLSNRDEHIVAESVVVIKTLLQTKAARHNEIICQMAKLLDSIKVPAARAAITWLIGEYNEKVPKIAPDVLRKLAKTFVDEEDIVKLQILNLAVKIYLTNPQQTSLLCQYVFTLARYDINYDIRDRARFLKQFIFPVNSQSTILSELGKKVFLLTKPAPALESKYHTRNTYQLGSMSHYLNMHCNGYNDLPAFPTVALDPSVRNVDGFNIGENAALQSSYAGNDKNKSITEKSKNKDFNKNKKYQDLTDTSTSFIRVSTEKSLQEKCDLSSESSTSSESSSSSSESGSDEEVSKTSHQTMCNPDVKKRSSQNTITNEKKTLETSSSGTSDDEDDSTSSSPSSSSNILENSEDGTSSSESDTSNVHLKQQPQNDKLEMESKDNSNRSNLDLLLDLDDIPPIGPIMTPTLGGFLTPGTPLAGQQPHQQFTTHTSSRMDLVGPSYVAYTYKELLNKLSGHGLQVNYRYTRSPHLYSSSMISIELQFINTNTNGTIENIRLGEKYLSFGMQMQEFSDIAQLNPSECVTRIMGVDFNDSTQSIDFEICSNLKIKRLTLKPLVGELIRSITISELAFKDECIKLRGMNEHLMSVNLKHGFITDSNHLKQIIFECINVACISSNILEDTKIFYFAGQTMSSKSFVLITCNWCTFDDIEKQDTITIQVNCEKMVIGSMVSNEITSTIQKMSALH